MQCPKPYLLLTVSLDSLRDMGRTWFAWTTGSFLGFFVGILPAAGATPGSLMAYGVAKMTSKNSDNFGKGEVAGVVAPESANNSASTGALLPMLTLGIPGSPTTAILLGGMVIWGLVPGPLLFVEQKEFVWGLIASLCSKPIFAFNQCGIYSIFSVGIKNAFHNSGTNYLRSKSCRRIFTHTRHA